MKKFKLLSIAMALMTLLCWVALPVQDTALAATAVPTGLAAVTASSSQINLTWNKVTGATSYKVFRSIGTSATYTQIASVITSKYNNTGLKAGTRYNYRVKAVKGSNMSGFSAVKTAYTKPAVPSGLKAIGSSAKQINLTWTAVAGATSYQVFRSIGTSSSYTRIATVTSPKYNNTGLTLGKRYNYKVRAIGKGGTGNFCAPVTGYPKPSVPTGLNAFKVSDTRIDLKWKAAAGAKGYKVYVSVNGGAYTYLAAVASLSYSHIRLAAGEYSYKVSAIASASESAKSSASVVVSVAGGLSRPMNLRAVATDTSSIALSWDKVDQAVTYAVYRSESDAGSYNYVFSYSSESCVITGLSAKTTYYFKVVAVDANNFEGEFSNYVRVTTLSGTVKPAKPSFTYVRSDSDGTAYFRPAADGMYKLFSSGNGTNWTQVHLIPNSFDAIYLQTSGTISYKSGVMDHDIILRFIAVNGSIESDPDDHRYTAASGTWSAPPMLQ